MMPTTLGIAGYVAPIVVISSLGTAYSLASMVFGGSPPFIVTWLIAQTGNLRIPGIMAQTPETSAWR
jgi:hypothetical protein